MTKERDLKTVVKELAVVKKRANVDLETVSWQTRHSFVNMKAEAQEKLKKLQDEYRRRVRSNTLGVFLFGDPARVKAFAKIAFEELDMLTVDAGRVYELLAARIEPSLGPSREFAATQLSGLIEGIRDMNREIGIRSMELPGIQEVVAVNNRQELISYVRTLVQKVVGDELLRVHVDNAVNEAAADCEFAAQLLTVSVSGLEREEVAPIATLFTNAVTVEVGTSEDGEVNKEYVLNQFKSFKSKLKGKQ